jgi:uncharacterized membrane protein
MPELWASVLVDAPLEDVWAFGMDITKIEQFHPRVDRVTLLDGVSIRAPGVSYQCNILSGRGRGSCVEKVTEVIPLQSFTTEMPTDSWGIAATLRDLRAITSFEPVGKSQTKVTIRILFDVPTLKAKLLALIVDRQLKGQTQQTLNAIKQMIESSSHNAADQTDRSR